MSLSGLDFENMTLQELELPEYLEPITLFKAYSDIMASEEKLEFLYQLWKDIPKLLKFKFWICSKNNSDYLTIH
jgi:hypothetical protein